MPVPIQSTIEIVLDTPLKNGVAWDISAVGTVVELWLRDEAGTITTFPTSISGQRATASIPKTFFTGKKSWQLRWRVQQGAIDTLSPEWLPFTAI